MTAAPRVTVVGSTLVDHVHRLEHVPAWGETVRALESTSFAGGKGLNQAIAASRLGAEVTVVGALGEDHSGGRVLRALTAEGVCTDFLQFVAGAETRRNMVTIDPEARVSFLQWAHRSPAVLSVDHILSAAEAIVDCDALLLTLEPAAEVVQAAKNLVMTLPPRDRPAVFINPAPAERMPVKLPWSFYLGVECLVPNLLEAAAVVDPRAPFDPSAFEDSRDVERARSLARDLRRRRVERACITIGARGCVSLDHGAIELHPGFPTDRALDTSGASDAFCAALALGLLSGDKSFEHAIQEANAAGAHAVTVLGAAPSMPTVRDIGCVLKTGPLETSRAGTDKAVGDVTRTARLRASTAIIGLVTAALALVRQLVAR